MIDRPRGKRLNILRMSANCSGVRRANIIMMAALILSSFVLLACGMSSCGRFNQSYLVEQAFGFNLREASVGKTIEEKNGLFIVRGVSEFDPIIKQTFSLTQKNVYQSTTYVPIQFEGNELGNQD